VPGSRIADRGSRHRESRDYRSPLIAERRRPARQFLASLKKRVSILSCGMPHRVQLKRTKGWHLPPNTQVVARPTRWGNPFHFKKPEERAQVVKRYGEWLLGKSGAEIRLAAKECLRGKNLACWCPLDGPCHADWLLTIANE